ncbi:MAG: hypothetical protein AB7N80_09960 [Bdellovibrionales bacterium]
MAQCPSCQTELKDDFGLVDCANCGAALYIEFDGSVSLRDAGGVGNTPTPQSMPQVPIASQAGFSLREPTQNFAMPQAAETSSAPEPLIEQEVPMHSLPAVAMSEPAVGGVMMDDLAAYGNSQESAGRDGAYFYDLVISGIDSADLRKEIKEALTDQMFLWDAEALIRSMNLGELVISRVTSVKAALLVQRLTGISVKLRWTQHAVIEA